MDYIEIKGYKSIKEARIDLLPINILIGSNGSGKSNLLSFFEFLDRLYNKRLQDYVGLKGGIEKFFYKGEQPSDAIEAKISFDNKVNSYSFEIRQSGNSFVFSKEVLWYYDRDLEYNDYTKEAQVKDNSWPRGTYIRKYITGYRKYHFHDTGQNSPFNSTMNVDKDGLWLYEKGENIAAFLYNIREKHTKIYKRIIETIKSVVPNFSDFVLQPNEAGNIKLYWQDRFSPYNYDVTDLSDGTVRFIALTVLLLQHTLPSTIIIDEPELGLHPFAISKLAGLIQSAASKNCQVIVATQSADLIGYFQPEDIIAVDNIDGKSLFTRLDPQKYSSWLEEYTLDELWKRNIINHAQPNY